MRLSTFGIPRIVAYAKLLPHQVPPASAIRSNDRTASRVSDPVPGSIRGEQEAGRGPTIDGAARPRSADADPAANICQEGE